MKAAKEVSAALLAGKKVGFYSEFPVEGELPEGLVRCDEYGNPVSSMDDRSEEETQKSSDFDGTGTDCTNIDCGVAVTVHTSCNPFISTTQVVPKCLTLGMGCRKDKDARGIAEAAQKVLDRFGFHKEAFEQIARGAEVARNLCPLLTLAHVTERSDI
ncbi:MAG: cobalamin biosynthesis central domain-containing protein, partial [Blautia wexlerae]